MKTWVVDQSFNVRMMCYESRGIGCVSSEESNNSSVFWKLARYNVLKMFSRALHKFHKVEEILFLIDRYNTNWENGEIEYNVLII